MLHVFLNFAYAFLVCACFLPSCLLLYLYSHFAYLHSSSYQGAKCFDHLFGFLYYLSVVLLITPATYASDIKKFSIASVRWSLFSLCCSEMLLNFSANDDVDVCVFHFSALLLCYAPHIYSIHWCLSSFCFVFAGLCISSWASSWGGDDGGGGGWVVCVLCGGWWIVSCIIGKYIYNRSWSDILYVLDDIVYKLYIVLLLSI